MSPPARPPSSNGTAAAGSGTRAVTPSIPAGRTVTALPSGAGAIGGLLGGQRLGGLADLGVVGGLLPETLGAPVAAGAIGLIGAGIALGKFTSATIEAGKALGTKESIGLGYASFQLRKQMTLMFAEIGQFYLPVLRGLVEATTSAIRWIRDILPGEDILHQGRSAMATGYDSQGRRTSYRIPRPTLDTSEVSDTHLQHRRSVLGVSKRIRDPVTGEIILAPEGQQPERMPWYERMMHLLAGSGGGHAQGLQHGGIVHPRPGGVITRVAEAGQSEAILPMNILGRMVSNQEQSWSRQQEMADAMQSSLQRAQDLPPLHQQLEEDAAIAAAATTVNVSWPPVNVLNWIPSGTPIPATGAYAVFTP